MLLHYLGKLKVQVCCKLQTWYNLNVYIWRNVKHFLPLVWIDIDTVTIVAWSVHHFPADMLKDAYATSHKLHCQWCSGPCHINCATSAAAVRQCYAPTTDRLAVGWHSITCSHPAWGWAVRWPQIDRMKYMLRALKVIQCHSQYATGQCPCCDMIEMGNIMWVLFEIYMVGQKSGPFLKVHKSCVWWRRKSFNISKCSAL